ncbi:MAG: hypothetical protein EBY95_01595, partial [Actinobacteria bacterium]|nr:hypothetical protein [Actinomycetota bacterium]
NDWYSGLPIYRFYMVVPALFIVALDILLPYGIALKLVAVAGLLALPLCTWLFARLARLAFPIPELLVVASTIFLFDESFTIYGGNIASTMAGEFSFSIALAFAVLGFGVFWRGIETGGYRIAATILLALSALSHGIVLLFAFLGYLLSLAMHKEPAKWKYGAPVIGTAVLLSAFWVLPFLLNHAYMTDMKYEPQPSGFGEGWVEMFFPLHIVFDVLITGFAVIGFLSALWRRSTVAAWLGIYGVLLAIGVFVARESLPIIGLLWNPRVLPFLYLVRYMLMMIGIYEAIVAVGRYVSLERAAARVAKSGEEQTLGPSLRGRLSFNVATAIAVSFVCISIIGFRFQELPFASVRTLEDGSQRYGLGPISVPAGNDGFVDGWARWNFTGYEGKNAYGEYRALIETMKQIGEDPRYGCGRALWENNGETNKYGTTMGLMLLPHWTDGCIGSMEGLFFEASATTPYHFIAAAAMSKQSSNPVRELRYDDNKAALGVRYLHLDRRIGEPGESGRRVDIVVPNETITQTNLAPVVVSDVVQGRSSVSFSVDTVGVPVLVRTSYFPNWNVSGATGPYRVAPNMMVVVPTSNDVRLSFGWSFFDIFAYVLTIAGIVVLVRWRRRRHVAPLL